MSTIHFLSLTPPGYSRSWTYFKGLEQRKFDVKYVRITKPYLTSLRALQREIAVDDEVVVTSPSQILAVLSRIVLGRRVVLDAGWSLFEGEVVSRRSYGFLGLRALKIYFIDYVACHSSKKIFVESYSQKKYFKKLFFIKSKKIEVLYTGLDEESFSSEYPPINYPASTENGFSVIFRGKYNSEAGLEVLSEATKLIKSTQITFSIYSPGLPEGLTFSESTTVFRQQLTKSEIAFLLRNSDLSLGQLSSNRRLSRTIPHKAFEAAFCSTPYLTARTTGVLELFSNSEIFTFEPGSASDLAAQILLISKNKSRREQAGADMRRRYDLEASQEILTEQFANQIGRGNN
jgi:glycosyltransferase involved in cell wall biosynthesis